MMMEVNIKQSLGQVSNFKLGCFASKAELLLESLAKVLFFQIKILKLIWKIILKKVVNFD